MTATLQKALKIQPNEWTNTTTVVTKTGATTYTAGPVVEATLERAYLYRIAVTAVTAEVRMLLNQENRGLVMETSGTPPVRAAMVQAEDGTWVPLTEWCWAYYPWRSSEDRADGYWR